MSRCNKCLIIDQKVLSKAYETIMNTQNTFVRVPNQILKQFYLFIDSIHNSDVSDSFSKNKTNKKPQRRTDALSEFALDEKWRSVMEVCWRVYIPRLVSSSAQPHANRLLNPNAGTCPVVHFVPHCGTQQRDEDAYSSNSNTAKVKGRVWDVSNCFYGRGFTGVMKVDVRLITDSVHHWTFFQRLHTSHLLTRFTSSARWSGSDFMIWSNSANWGT